MLQTKIVTTAEVTAEEGWPRGLKASPSKIMNHWFHSECPIANCNPYKQLGNQKIWERKKNLTGGNRKKMPATNMAYNTTNLE